MKNHLRIGSKLVLATALLFSASAVSVPSRSSAATGTAPSVIYVPSALVKEYGVFLKDKYNIAFGQQVTTGQYSAAVNTILAASSVEVTATGKATTRLKSLDALQLALKAADLEELAYTYPTAKTKKSLSKLKLNWKSDAYASKQAQALAAAVDTGLVPSEFYGEIGSNGTVSASLATFLLGKVLETKGQYKRYIGYASDSDIYAKLNDAYRTSDIIKAPDLRNIVDEALKQDLVTGYNLKDSRYDANFVNSLSLVYGHSDFKHALQLIGLLRSENINAKVQFEPKTSAFIYLKEWGEPGVSDLFEVVQIENGNYIEYAKEYDLAFEFATTADKSRFDQIVLKFAKKNEDNQPGLIYGSWWQPLYYSLTELKNYKIISNNKIETGNYYAQSFSLKEKSAAVTAGFKKLDPSVKVTNYDFWVDGPFFNYLNGESK
ncbi:hypothetical protein [Cohnella herbarum]|uniref:SLH domain-containing protein n=1 Tax=Cohnella herbarum TaxID=2728023 RepID=A0A7Z2VG31_9BACL|nr:hypothetical protein [Cohnella herbarum]QJD82229.1 hypothetical protein HH215_02890 [Cohnella herbarum]